MVHHVITQIDLCCHPLPVLPLSNIQGRTSVQAVWTQLYSCNCVCVWHGTTTKNETVDNECGTVGNTVLQTRLQCGRTGTCSLLNDTNLIGSTEACDNEINHLSVSDTSSNLSHTCRILPLQSERSQRHSECWSHLCIFVIRTTQSR